MLKFTFNQEVKQLEKRQGGYFYLKIDSEIVNQFPKKRHTRLVCNIDDKVQYSCGLNHLGDGNFFIILSTKNLDKLGKTLGEKIQFEIFQDPNPLGVEVPEVLLALLEQDPISKKIWEAITDGKKRSLIYGINKIKDIDKQVNKALEILELENQKLKKKTKKF